MVSPGMHNMQMVNFNNLLNGKDSRWLQLEVCREFQRNKCTRPDTECKFAHPPVNVEVQNGRVTACYDSIKGRCNREKPPCKYFHPPQHLKDQLLINGRNHLALKNAFMTQIQGLSPGTQLVHGTLPVQPSSPYLASIPTMANFNPYIASSPVMTVGMTEAVASPITGVVPQQVVPAQKVPRTDRLEAFPGMGVPYKRPAPDKSGLPVYQPTGNAAYQQALMQQLGAQSYVPVSCEYGSSSSALLALPPPTADGSTHSPPSVIHNASSSSAQAEAPSSSSSLASSSSASITYSSPSFPSNTLSSSASGKASSLHIVSSSVSPSLPANVISYTGYALNKGGIRPPTKSIPANPYVAAHAAAAAAAAAASAASASSSAVPAGLPSNFTPGSVTPSAFSNLGFGVGIPPPVGLGGFQMPGNMTMMAPQGVSGGLMQAAGMPMMPNVANVGAGVVPSSVFSPQLVYSQFPSSSVYLPQITALSNNPQLSWAQAGEQPYKKLKTS